MNREHLEYNVWEIKKYKEIPFTNGNEKIGEEEYD